MAQLAAQRQQAIARKVVPAIVDAVAWDTLHLSPGATFTLNFASVDYSEVITFTAIARVEHIPTPGDTATPGVLADYTSFSSVYNQKAVSKEQFLIPLNFVWLRTTGTPAALKSVRTELTSGNFQLDPIYDRQATLDDLHNDPLYLTLLGLLGLGATIALLLALAGNLIASWLSASGRRTNFAVLRALGSSQRQIASVLLWEQSILLLTALVLGLIFGALLAVMVLPALLFTSVPSNETNGPITKRPPDVFASNFFAVQSVPPISLVLPPSLYIVLAVLIAICLLAIGMMVRIVFRPSMAQVLRLNED
jgi:ABC-type antimicrobial peptide transport system permease subunit